MTRERESRRRAGAAWRAGAAMACGVVLAGCGSEGPRLSQAQEEAVDALRDLRDRGEINDDEYDEVRAQIRPASAIRRSYERLDAERTDLDDLIGVQGYIGVEDCVEPPASMLLGEIVPRTPADPTERLLARTNKRGADLAARATLDAYLSAGSAPSTLDATLAYSDVDPWGRYHARFQQTHDGVPVLKGDFFIHENASGGHDVTDHTLSGIDVDVVPTFDAGRAIETALTAIDPTGGDVYTASPVLMVDPGLENVLIDAGDPENGASYEWRVDPARARLVYRVAVTPTYNDLRTSFDALLDRTTIAVDASTDPAERDAHTLLKGREEEDVTRDPTFAYPNATPYLLTIDANTLEVIETESLIVEDLGDFQAPPNTGTGYGWFNSRVELNTTFVGSLDAYVLADFTRSKEDTANIVLHGRNRDTHDVEDFELFLDQNDVWGSGDIDFPEPACRFCSDGQTPAVDVAFGMQRTYDFLENVLGRFGIDDAGLSQVAVAHWDSGYADAHFNGSSGLIAFGNGEAGEVGPGNYSIGTVAHEIGHAIWKQEEVGTAGNPAKAMNEGHGDVLGALVDIYQDNTDGQGDWLYRIPWTGGKWRSRTLDPEGYEECVTSNEIEMCRTGRKYWDLLLESETFEHVAGIPFTRAIMHLAEGTSDDPTSPYYSKFFPDEPMRGIGLNKAAAIWIHMVSHFLPSSPNLNEARIAAWEAAEDLYGPSSTEARATANAFAAVGMGARAPGSSAPTISFAKVHTLNLRTLTARTYAVLDDDTGAEFVEPDGMARKNDAFLGYLDLSELPLGKSAVTFRAVDSEGNAATTTRICNLPYRPQLLQDGGFERNTNSDWTNATKRDDEGGALFGEKYLEARTTPTRQAVDLRLVKGPELSYWVGANKWTEAPDLLRVRVLDPAFNELALLAVHDIDDPWFPRPARSNGYVNFRHDLSDWEGQEIVIEFEATTNNRYRIDHVVVSYATVQLLPPQIELFETDNTVVLTVFDEDFDVFSKMGLFPRIDVDGQDVGPLTNGGFPTRRYVALPLDALGEGAHFTNTVAVDADDDVIAAGSAAWFAPKPVNELLSNGRFESQLDDWTPVGSPVSLENANVGFVYQGDFAVRLGGAGVVNDASIEQTVSVPSAIKSLKLTLRARREFSGADDDALIVEFLNASDEVLDSAVLYDSMLTRLDHDPPSAWNTHILLEYAPSTAALAGKTVKLRLRVNENASDPSAWVVDNVSFSFAEWGYQVGG